MSNITNITDHRLNIKNKALQSDGGDGTFNDMEARVAKLENDVSDIKIILARIETKIDSYPDFNKLSQEVSYIKGKVESAPTTIQLIGFAVAVFVAAGLFRFFGN